jgi:hypothetical protein
MTSYSRTAGATGLEDDELLDLDELTRLLMTSYSTYCCSTGFEDDELLDLDELLVLLDD